MYILGPKVKGLKYVPFFFFRRLTLSCEDANFSSPLLDLFFYFFNLIVEYLYFSTIFKIELNIGRSVSMFRYTEMITYEKKLIKFYK